MLKSEKWKVIVSGFIFDLFTMTFGRFAYTLILPDMKKLLGLSNTVMGLFGMGIVTGYLLNSIMSGKLSEIIGEKRTAKISVMISSFALFSLGYFSNVIVLFIAFLLIGAGASGSYVPMIGLANKISKKKSLIFGLIMSGTGVGIMLTGYFVPIILVSKGYRTTWYILSLINLVGFFAGLLLLKEDGYKKSTHKDDRSEKIIVIFSRNRALSITVLIYFLLGFAYVIYATFFGDYSINEIGFSRKSTGFMWSLFGINTIYSGILWGFFGEKGRKVRVAILVDVILLVSILIIIIFKFEFLFFVSTFLFGLSFMGFIILITSLISDEVDPPQMAKIFGASTLIHGSGQVIATSISGYLKDLTGTFKVPFSLSVIALMVNVYLLLKLMSLLNNKNKGQPQ